MYKYRNEKNKAIGTDGWDADHEESSSSIYTGLWNDSVLVGLIVEHMGDDDSHDEMCARFHAKAQDVVNKCNAYNELLTIQAQLVEALQLAKEYVAPFIGVDLTSKSESVLCEIEAAISAAMSRDDGGPAFARSGHEGDSTVSRPQNGMSLRDYLAGKVLQGLAANPGGPWQANSANGWALANCTLADVVEVAYQTADAALVERTK